MVLRSVLLVLFTFCAATTSCRAAIITQWTFETTPPAGLLNSTLISGIAADTGTGTASGLHASAATDWSTPSGNGSANSLSSNTWAIGDYYQFSSSTIGFKDIVLNWSQTSSLATGPRDFKLAYQINGGVFSDFQTYTVSGNSGTWSGAPINSDLKTFDLSSVLGLNNVGSVSFRLIDNSTVSANGGTVASSGTNRVDDFTINGSTFTPAAVPEPASVAFLGALVLGGMAQGRFRTKSSHRKQ